MDMEAWDKAGFCDAAADFPECLHIPSGAEDEMTAGRGEIRIIQHHSPESALFRPFYVSADILKGNVSKLIVGPFVLLPPPALHPAGHPEVLLNHSDIVKKVVFGTGKKDRAFAPEPDLVVKPGIHPERFSLGESVNPCLWISAHQANRLPLIPGNIQPLSGILPLPNRQLKERKLVNLRLPLYAHIIDPVIYPKQPEAHIVRLHVNLYDRDIPRVPEGHKERVALPPDMVRGKTPRLCRKHQEVFVVIRPVLQNLAQRHLSPLDKALLPSNLQTPRISLLRNLQNEIFVGEHVILFCIAGE